MVRTSILMGVLALALSACCCFRATPDAMAELPPAVQYIDKDFVIYFGWDQDTLTPAASALVDEIADYSRGMDNASLSVRGHTDSSGSAAYNDGLSQRRASRVVGALAANGITGVGSTWAGESELAVETNDNAREPLNRRVNVRITGQADPGS